ncbi:MAG: hypothetical protein IJ583_01595 [Firmicutes bacterium]|nr:hypothetical protein [Bacillota bacterium]
MNEEPNYQVNDDVRNRTIRGIVCDTYEEAELLRKDYNTLDNLLDNTSFLRVNFSNEKSVAKLQDKALSAKYESEHFNNDNTLILKEVEQYMDETTEKVAVASLVSGILTACFTFFICFCYPYSFFVALVTGTVSIYLHKFYPSRTTKAYFTSLVGAIISVISLIICSGLFKALAE